MIHLAIHGARGRMGRCVGRLAGQDERFVVVAEINRADPCFNSRDPLPPCDVVVDFSSPDGAKTAIRRALEADAALLIGTTGLPDDVRADANRASSMIPIIVASNTSTGVAILNLLAVTAARLLCPDFEISIVETHHEKKQDIPSGTAVRLVDHLARHAECQVRSGAVQSVRTGVVPGTHELIFTGSGEELRIRHQAFSRDLFGQGALRAAAWLNDREPGLFTMEHVLGIHDTP